MINEFVEKNGELYINGKKVLKAWESFTGWYWFAVEKCDCGIPTCDRWFGLVQGFEEEWGYFSENELKALGKSYRVWEIPKKDLIYSGRRGLSNPQTARR